MRTIIGWAGLLLAVCVAAGCAVITGQHQVGRPIATWNAHDDEWLDGYAPKSTLLLTDAEARDAFLRQVADEVDDATIQAVRQADLKHGMLVLGSYGKCKQRSRVWMNTEQTNIWFESYVPRPDRNTDCGEMTLTLDVWLVSDDDLGEVPVAELIARPPRKS